MSAIVGDRRAVVSCLGSSSTAGQGQAFGWIDELERRPQNRRFDFRNFGVGGDLAYNAPERVPAVIASHPDKVVVLIGANDVLTMVFANARRVLAGWMKRLPKEPSVELFRESLEAIVDRLKRETTARIALSSLGPIGEDPDSLDSVQRTLNERTAELSRIIRETAALNQLAYVPFFETLSDHIAAIPGKAFTDFRFLPIYLDTFRFYALRRSSDEIAQANGWRFHVDGVHLNRRGGMILANLVQEFLDS